VVHGVRGNAEHSALREMVAGNLNTRSGRHETRQTLARSAVDAESLLDAVVEVLEILDLLERRHVVGGQSLVELVLQFLRGVRAHEHVEKEGAGGVGSGVGAGDELGESFGGEFGAAEFVAVLVFAFHETGQQVHAIDLATFGGFETLVHASDGDASEVLHGCYALVEERIREVFGVRLDPWDDANGVGDLSTTVKNLNSRSVSRRGVWARSHFSNVFSSLKHAKRGTKSKITDDVECNVVEPVQAVHTVVAVASLLAELVPLGGEHLEVVVHILLKLTNALRAKGVRDGLALASVLGAVSCVEETALDRHKSVIVLTLTLLACSDHDCQCGVSIRFEESSSVAVDDGNGIRVGD
jgi:hypothetical protein